MYAARAAWLDAPLRWEAGAGVSYVLPDGAGAFTPTETDVARAEFCLNRIASHPHSARVAFGDLDGWLTARTERLNVAKRIVALLAHATLSADSADTDAGTLAPLLVPEALSECTPPFSPTGRLLRLSSAATAALRAVSGDVSLPLCVRTLAALTLGALRRRDLTPVVGNAFARGGGPAALSAGFALGSRYGMPADPAPVALLLAAQSALPVEGALRQARRFLAARADCAIAPAFAPPRAFIHALLSRGEPEAACVATGLMEAVAEEAGDIARLLRRRRHELPSPPAAETRAAAEAMRRQRTELVRAAGRLLHEYLGRAVAAGRTDLLPTVACQFAGYVRGMLDPEPLLTPHIDAAVLRPLRAGLDEASVRSPAIALAWLSLLERERASLWGALPAPAPLKARGDGWLNERLTAARERTRYLDVRWGNRLRPALELLCATGDADLVRQVLDRGALDAFRWREGRSAGWYRAVLAAGGRVTPPGEEKCPPWNQICDLIDTAGTPPRADLSHLFGALRAARPALRAELLEAMADELRCEGDGRRAPLLVCFRATLPLLVRFAESLGVEPGFHFWSALLHVAFATGTDCLADLVERMREPRWAKELREDACALSDRLRLAADMAVAVEPDVAPDRLRLRVAALLPRLAREYTYDESLRRSLPLLQRFPALRGAITGLIEGQTGRCLRFLARLGSADYAGSDGAPLAPLAELDPGVPSPAPGVCVSDDPEWSELLTLAPDLASLTADYWYASYLLGVDDPPVPPGVRRAALDAASRLERELAYLDERGESGYAGIDARRINLRARLANAERLRTVAAEEARERLAAVTSEARMAAAERLLTACYRARLGAMLGRGVGPDLAFDDDLYNAVRVATDIKANRRLLLRLLRAHVAAPGIAREFVRRHPRNREFVAMAAARGVDVEVWLGEHPRVIRLPATGACVRLHLERDPLRILQMGNPFGTCLSAGAFNAFSTVANACELNKRVLFAYDAHTGQVVGRKLIGLTEDLRLVGFQTYTNLDNAADAEALRAAVRFWLLEFAARGNLTLADEGTIPTLFAEEWYDDGAVSWEPAPSWEPRTLRRRGVERGRRLPAAGRS
jgi:hypothetical protein